ncbi:hypothetical protein [Desertivirga arenae]|uniref:hypothetical protein n=1 Tax=Desertivirga arenae TaxID=2810309 RepID=UPI001A957228|nr:hypothetical protein [Pedobacter sp. SYSU D00823]
MRFLRNLFRKKSHLASERAPINKLEELISHWDRKNIRLNSGIAYHTIRQFENEFEFSFEDDFFIDYLLRINGFEDFEWDENLFSFWSLDRMREENSDGYHSSDAIWFCDHSINLCSFGFSKTDNKIYTEYQTLGAFQPVASSFDEFIRLYLKDPNSLLR